MARNIDEFIGATEHIGIDHAGVTGVPPLASLFSCYVESTANINIATSGSLTPVPFDNTNSTEVIDNGGFHDPAGGNPERLTVPASAGGYYTAGAVGEFAAGGGSKREFCVVQYRPPSTLIRKFRLVVPPVSGDVTTGVVSGFFPDVQDADYFQFEVFQDTGGALNLLHPNIQLWVVKIL